MSEKVYIIQPVENEHYRTLHSEAVALIGSAGAEYAGTTYQNIREINPATYIGSGKAEEINAELGESELTVLFNGDLSPSQVLNLSDALGGRKVIDRTTLILDIFALRAESSEGKIQVELAQLKYIYPRLRGKGAALSRLGGGIGTRGPGETKLETDRRHIKSRIHALEEKLGNTERRRSFTVQRRKKERVRTIALVGYTNVGKSTLMNALTQADVLVQDALFATLDPTSRSFEIEGIPFLLVDTVGFLQNLPHHLIEAFKSTLESAVNCDLALIVCDGADDYQTQLKTTLDTLKSLGFVSPYLVVMNKCDKINDTVFPGGFVQISAKTGAGLEELKERILKATEEEFYSVKLLFPYAEMKEYGALRSRLFGEKSDYTDDGLSVSAKIDRKDLSKFSRYLKELPRD